MLDVISMFGVKIHPHRSFLLIALVLCSIVAFLLLSSQRRSATISELAVETSDEDINLIDLFHHAFRLTHQAGQAIKSLKNTKKNLAELFKKKAFADLPSEPVTIADLLSHSILTEGLKKKFANLQIVSEEKDPVNEEQFRTLRAQFDAQDPTADLPKIDTEKDLLTVPLSSVAVWLDPLDATKEFTEDLTQYVMVMVCVTVEKKPTIGILYSPFSNQMTWGWVGVDRSIVKRDPNSLMVTHQANIDEIVISRSHAGQAHELLRGIYRDKQYKIIPAAGSGYKTVQVLEEYADYYLHITPIKKWDLCAPDAVLRANHGRLSTLLNETISYDHHSTQMLITNGLLATYKRNHDELLSFLTHSNLTKHLSSKKS